MAAPALTHLVRPPAGEPEGMLVLFHGRGADERDLYPLLDVLDPERRLLGVTPRGPLHLPPGGAHWYAVREIGYPDPDTFSATFTRSGTWLDVLAADDEISWDRVVLGGFSQGAVIAYALGLGEGRPCPAALLALSEGAGAQVLYHESPLLVHTIDPGFLRTLPVWLRNALERPSALPA